MLARENWHRIDAAIMSVAPPPDNGTFLGGCAPILSGSWDRRCTSAVTAECPVTIMTATIAAYRNSRMTVREMEFITIGVPTCVSPLPLSVTERLAARPGPENKSKAYRYQLRCGALGRVT